MIVVCVPGGRRGLWDLPESTLVERTVIGGGERTLYEIAFAAAATGRTVELRGWISRTVFQDFCHATADHVPPQVQLPPRRPTADDCVIVPEGGWPVDGYGALVFSPARLVMALLAPPGLFGWPFHEPWSLPNILTVATESVARNEHFQAIDCAGFSLWTNSAAISERAHASGVPCRYIGSGTPIPFPPVPRKRYDLVTLEANRWAGSASEVIARLRASHQSLGLQPHPGLLQALGEAKVLVWPSRLEGSSRIQREARAMGTVPVALPNPFAEGLTREEGAIVVRSVDDMPEAIETLFARPDEWQDLSVRASTCARASVSWVPFVERVDAGLATLREPDQWRRLGEHLTREMVHAVSRDLTREMVHAVSRETDLFRRRVAVRIADGFIGRIWRVLRRLPNPSE